MVNFFDRMAALQREGQSFAVATVVGPAGPPAVIDSVWFRPMTNQAATPTASRAATMMPSSI